MPKETLALLERDTERLLFAGAAMARGDADLDARRQKLAALAAKAPVLGKVVEQVEKAQKASGKNAAVELLNLSAQMAQVRGAQAAPLPAAGDLAPLPPSDPVESPLSPTELLSLVNALTVSGKHRPRIVADAVDRGAVRDLRLLPFCVRALGDPAVGYVVEEKLLPALGRLVVPELLATIRIEKGKEIDAKKLKVLASILGDAARPMLVEATEKGSPEIRRTAIAELGDRDPALAEPIALRLLAGDKSSEVRRAAVDALAGAKSDEALDALFKAFTSGRELRAPAGRALGRLDHPRTTDRALALLTPDLLGLGNLRLPKADTKAQKEENEKLQRAHAEKVSLLSDVLDLLASRKDKLETAEKVLSIFQTHKVKEVKNAAALALLKSGYQKAFDELAPSVYEADWQTQDGFVEGILDHDPDHAFERLGRFLDPASFKGKNHVAFAGRILGSLEGQGGGGDEPAEDEEEADDRPEVRTPHVLQKDARWTEAAIKLLDHKELSDGALDVLGQVKSDRAREAVLAHAAAQKKAEQGWRILRILQTYKDPRVPPQMLRFLDLMQGSWARRWVFRTLREYDDPAVLPGLEAWAGGKKKLDNRDKEELEETVRFLSRDRALSAGV